MNRAFPRRVAMLGCLVAGIALAAFVGTGVQVAAASDGAGGCDLNGDSFEDPAWSSFHEAGDQDGSPISHVERAG